jgi:hypothetical protein
MCRGAVFDEDNAEQFLLVGQGRRDAAEIRIVHVVPVNAGLWPGVRRLA